MAQLFKNNANSTLAQALAANGTTLQVQSADASKFPAPGVSDFFLATLYQVVANSESNHEVVKVTARAGASMTIVRAQEGTTARAFNANDPIQMRATAGTYDLLTNTIATHKADTNNPHGMTKAQLGLGSVDNTADAEKPISIAQQTALNTLTDALTNKIDVSQKGAAGGVAPLGGDNKIPATHIPTTTTRTTTIFTAGADGQATYAVTYLAGFGLVDVFTPGGQNLIEGTHFTASNGTSVVLDAAVAALIKAGDKIVVKAFTALNLAVNNPAPAATRPLQASVPYAATKTIDCSLGEVIDITLTGNITLSFINFTDGMKLAVRLRQGGTGSYTVAFGATQVTFGTDLPSTAIVLSTAVGKTDILGFIYRAAATRMDLVSFVKGY